LALALFCVTLTQSLQPDPLLHLLSIKWSNLFWVDGLPDLQKIHVFRCGATGLYALTADSAGRNLPTQACKEKWQFEQSIALRLDNSVLKHELTKATLAAIAKHGFYLTHAAIHALPFATVHNEAGHTEF